MNDLDITFENSPWEQVLVQLSPGDCLSAAHFLTLLEGEEEQTVEDAVKALEERRITLDISDLPRLPDMGADAQRLHMEAQLAQTEDMIKALGENDPLRLYLEEVAQTRTEQSPQALAQRLAAGDRGVVRDLLDGMLATVIGLAKEYTGRGVLLLDLIQEANLGLWQAIQSYTGGDFEAYCQWWCRQYLAQAVTLQARQSGVGQKLRQALEDYRSVDERLLTELGRNPTLEEIAQGLHMTVEETAAAARMLDSARALQRAKKPQEEALPQEEDQAGEDTAYFQMRQRISELLSGVSEQDATLLTLRYGLEGGVPMEPEQVAQRLGITVQAVMEAEASALAKLRSKAK